MEFKGYGRIAGENSVKIVSTLGPASSSKEMLQKLFYLQYASQYLSQQANI